MNMLRMRMAFTLAAIGLSVASVAAAPADPVTTGTLQQQLQEIQRTAKAHGVTVQNVRVERTLQLDASGSTGTAAQMPQPRCTVTTPRVIAGVATNVAATAPTCAESAAMVRRLVTR